MATRSSKSRRSHLASLALTELVTLQVPLVVDSLDCDKTLKAKKLLEEYGAYDDVAKSKASLQRR